MNNVIEETHGSIVFELNDYINENISIPLTASDLCKRFKINRNSLYKISETYFGIPIAKYITKKRIEKAIELICSGVSVTGVSDKLVFCDYGYFGKIFKKITGYTPTQIKEKEINV